MGFNKGIAWALGLGATVFVLLLGGLFSGALTDDPPAVNPYATGSSEEESDVFETDAYEDATETTTDSTEPPASSTTEAPAAEEAAQITIANFAFGDPIQAKVGQEVTVTNSGGSHTWTSDEGLFDSGTLRAGDSFTFVFDEPGTYGFFCAIHPSMTGSITIEG